MRSEFGCLTFAAAVLLALPAQSQDSLSFRDEFTGSTLAPEFRVLNPDPDRMALVEGDYLLLLPHRDYKNSINYVKKLPENYQIKVRFASTPIHDHQGAEIRLSGSDSFLSAGLYANLSPWDRFEFFFNKHIGDDADSYVKNINPSNIKPFYISIIKSGLEYSSEYSFDGMNWSKIGTHLVTRSLTTPSIGVYTWNGDAPETPIRVDSFEITDLTAH